MTFAWRTVPHADAWRSSRQRPAPLPRFRSRRNRRSGPLAMVGQERGEAASLTDARSTVRPVPAVLRPKPRALFSSSFEPLAFEHPRRPFAVGALAILLRLRAAVPDSVNLGLLRSLFPELLLSEAVQVDDVPGHLRRVATPASLTGTRNRASRRVAARTWKSCVRARCERRLRRSAELQDEEEGGLRPRP